MKNNEIKLQQSEIFEIERFKNYKPIRDLLDSLMPTIDYEDSKSDCVNLPIALGLQARASISGYGRTQKNHGFKFVTRVRGDRFYVWKVDETVSQEEAVNVHTHYRPREIPDNLVTITVGTGCNETYYTASGMYANATGVYEVTKEKK